MSYTDQEIQDKASLLVENGADESTVRQFIDTAKSEQLHSAQPELGTIEKVKAGVSAVAKEAYELAPGPSDIAEVVSGKDFLIDVMSKGVLGAPASLAVGLVKQKPKRFDYAAEIGIPTMAQLLTSPLAGTGIMSLVGASTSAVGNILAQGRRVAMGEQENRGFYIMPGTNLPMYGIDAGQLVAATGIGGLPFGAAGKPMFKSAGPILRTLAETATQTGKMSAAGLGAETARIAIDEGRLPTQEEAILAAALPAGLTIVQMPVGLAGKRMQRYAKEVAERAKKLEEAGITPTVGMATQGGLAITERKMAEKTQRGGRQATKVEGMYTKLDENIPGVGGFKQSKSEIFEKFQPYIGAVEEARDSLMQLNEQARAGYDAVDKASAKLAEARVANDLLGISTYQTEMAKASNDAFIASMDSVVDNWRRISVESIAGNMETINPANARSLTVDHVIKPMKAAYDRHWSDLYGQFDNESKVFDGSRIARKADEMILDLTSAKAEPKLKGALDAVKASITDGPTNLKDLRTTRENLIGRLRTRGFESTQEERLIKEMAATITKELDSQATDAFGQELGQEFRRVNQGYAKYKDKIHQPGVDILWDKQPDDGVIEKVINEFLKSGTEGDSYKGIANLQKYLGEFAPELSAVVEDEFHRVLRGHILYRNAVPIGGKMSVSSAELQKDLESLFTAEGSDKAIKLLGLGTTETLQDVQKAHQKWGKASDLTTDQWEALFASRNMAKAAGKANNFAQDIDVIFGESQAKNLASKSNALASQGKVKDAMSALDEANQALKRIGYNEDAAQQKLDTFMKDPAMVAFDKPALNARTYDQLNNTVLNPAVFTDVEFKDWVAGLERGNPSLLNDYRERVLADFFSDDRMKSPAYMGKIEIPDVEKMVAKSSEAKGREIEHFKRVKNLLTPEQGEAIDNLSGVFSEFAGYQRATTAGQTPVSFNVPLVGEERRWYDAIGNMIRSGEYRAAARLLVGKTGKVAERAQVVSDVAGVAATAATTAGQTAVAQTARVATEKASGRDALREATQLGLPQE